jgi:hypothetical protein
MKKEGIQTRKRKPKNQSSTSNQDTKPGKRMREKGKEKLFKAQKLGN